MAKNKAAKLAGSLLAVLVAAGAAQGCSAADETCEIDAELDSFSGSVDALVAAEVELRAKLAYACAQIAGDDSVSENNTATSDEVTTLCSAARVKIDAQANLTIEIVPPVCEVNIEVQANCEAECEAKFQCEGGEIEARCEGGEVSVKCEGSCEASARCEVTATAP